MSIFAVDGCFVDWRLGGDVSILNFGSLFLNFRGNVCLEQCHVQHATSIVLE